MIICEEVNTIECGYLGGMFLVQSLIVRFDLHLPPAPLGPQKPTLVIGSNIRMFAVLVSAVSELEITTPFVLLSALCTSKLDLIYLCCSHRSGLKNLIIRPRIILNPTLDYCQYNKQSRYRVFPRGQPAGCFLHEKVENTLASMLWAMKERLDILHFQYVQ